MATLTTSYQYLGQASIGTDGYGNATYIRIYAKYSEQSIANNQTYVYYQARVYHTTSSWIRDGQGSASVWGTSATTTSGGCTSKVSGEVTVATTGAWVTHNADGTKSVSCGASLSFPNWGWSNSVSATATLPSIPRKANINSAPNFTDEQNPTITYTNSAGNSVTTLQACISFDGSKADIAYRDISKTGTSYTFSLTDAERNVLRNACTTAKSRTVIFYVKTVIGGVTYYSTLSKTLSIVNANPTLSPTITDTDSAMVALTGNASTYLVKGYSDAKFTVGATGVKGATIKSVKVTGGGGSSTATSGTISNVTNASFTFTATDSRGNTASKTITKTLITYTELSCELSATNISVDGNLTLTIKGNYHNGSIGATANTLTVQYRVNSGSWTTVTATKSGNTYSATVSLTGLNYESSYTYQARAIDKVKTSGVNSVSKVVKGLPVFDWGENDFTVNGGLSANTVHIVSPGGGQFTTRTADFTGYLKITLPVSWTNTMIRFFVDIYDYTMGGSVTYMIAGYNYSATPSWTYTTVSVIGNNLYGTTTNRPVNFGHDGTKCAITIGSSTTRWRYPQVVVRDVVLGFQNSNLSDWYSGWNISFTTAALSTIKNTWNYPNSQMGAGCDSNGYYGMVVPGGQVGAWVRTTSKGLLPYTSGGTSALGTSAWPFDSIYGNNIYANNIKLATNKILATTASFMTDTQTITLTEKISAQANGIVLVFSYYDSQGARNWDYNFHFIPKYFVNNINEGGSVVCLSNNAYDSYPMAKVIYVYNTKLIGHSANNSSQSNASWVLRYVIGV